jgi:hypothetical protein
MSVESDCESDASEMTVWNKLIESGKVDTTRRIKLYSLGENNKDDRKIDNVERIFDLRKFDFEFPELFNRKFDNGMDDALQESIAESENFDAVIEKIVMYIEDNAPQSIGIMCMTGKLHSVSFIEMLKHDLYSKAIVNHIALGGSKGSKQW